jgi:DegV family protein with EDD domain
VTAAAVRVVTDSTADLPRPLAERLGIAVVPLTVRFGDRAFQDGVDLSPAEFLAELRAAPELPKTSQPPTTAFEEVFRAATDAGQDVVCVTLAATVSGTHNAARLAAEAVAPERVRILDSGSASFHTGFGAIAAAEAAQSGGDLAAVEAAARSALGRAHLYAVLETLEYLQKGGRIGKAAALVGSLLSIKPILTVRDGDVLPLERVRTWRKALDRIVELGRAQAPLAGLAVLHVGNPAAADLLADRLTDLVPRDEIVRGEIGPVVATYAGPGTVGIVALRAE